MLKVNILAQIDCPICGSSTPSGEFIHIQDMDYDRSFYKCRNTKCTATHGMTYTEFYAAVSTQYHINRPDVLCREVTEYDIKELLTIIQERDVMKERWTNFMKKHLFSPELAENITTHGKKLIDDVKTFMDNACTMLANQELHEADRIYIKNFERLIELDPPALMSDGVNYSNGYLERPENGWMQCISGFIGIGYDGNQAESFDGKWFPAKAGLGHIPTNGYG